MPHTADTLDIVLLRNNKKEFILRCQRIIEIIVKHFIKNGLFAAEQLYDSIQSVNEELIRRLPSVEKNFNGTVLMVTYMNVVIRNICIDLSKQEHNIITTVSLENVPEPAMEEEISPALFIQDEQQRLKNTLKLYRNQQHKILLCLKLYFRQPLTENDILRCFRKSTASERSMIYNRFGTMYDDTMEIDNFNFIAPLMNHEEENTTSGNSLRRWTEEHLQRIISILNGNGTRRTHSRDTIKYLLDHQ